MKITSAAGEAVALAGGAGSRGYHWGVSATLVNFINSRPVEPRGGRYLDNFEPATGRVVGRVPESTAMWSVASTYGSSRSAVIEGRRIIPNSNPFPFPRLIGSQLEAFMSIHARPASSGGSENPKRAAPTRPAWWMWTGISIPAGV